MLRRPYLSGGMARRAFRTGRPAQSQQWCSTILSWSMRSVPMSSWIIWRNDSRGEATLVAGLYAHCRAIVCPLDPNTHEATHSPHDEPCEYLLASVQPGGAPGGCGHRGDCARPLAKIGNCTTQNGERFP